MKLQESVLAGLFWGLVLTVLLALSAGPVEPVKVELHVEQGTAEAMDMAVEAAYLEGK